jgi:hypothetical protein
MTDSLSEHVTAVQAALGAARLDGYLLQGWTDDYHNDSFGVDLMLIRNRRGLDGVMRNEERALIERVWT